MREELSAYASAKGVGRLSMWSLNRDRTCSPNYPDVKQVSDGCSGVEQGSHFCHDPWSRRQWPVRRPCPAAGSFPAALQGPRRYR